jgi:hypothetical protein
MADPWAALSQNHQAAAERHVAKLAAQTGVRERLERLRTSQRALLERTRELQRAHRERQRRSLRPTNPDESRAGRFI